MSMRRTPARTHITETIVLEFEALSLSQPWAQAAFGLTGLLLLAWVVQLLVQLVLTRGVARLGVAAGATGFSAVLLDRAVLRRVAQIAPALLVLLVLAQARQSVQEQVYRRRQSVRTGRQWPNSW